MVKTFRDFLQTIMLEFFHFEFYMKALIFFIVPLYLLIYYAFNLYTPKRVQGRRLELSNIIMANTVGILIVFAGFFLVLSYTEEAKNFSRSMFAYFLYIQHCT